MFRFTKKDFIKFLTAPLTVANKNKKSRFSGFSKERIQKILTEPEEWMLLSKKNQSTWKLGVIPYLEDLIHGSPEKAFDNFFGLKLKKKKLQIGRDLLHWFREENMFFCKEDSIVFEVEDLGPRSTGLTQIMEESEINEDESSLMNDGFIEESVVEEEWVPESEVVEEVEEIEEIEQVEEVEEEEDAEFVERDVGEDDSISNIFLRSGKLPNQGKGGDNRTWSPKFIKMSLELLIKGEKASSVHNFMATTAKNYPELLGEGKRVPSERWFQRLRDALKYLNREHTKDVVVKGDRFFLASDGAAMSDASKAITVGVLNEAGRLHLLGIELAKGGTGTEIAEQMIEIIDGTGVGRILARKIDVLMSDQASAQKVANAIVAERLTREINEDSPPSLFCCMHSISNCCKNSRNALEEVNPDAVKLLELIKSVYGKPEKVGYVQQDGRADLRLMLRYDLEQTRTKIFSHDLGKRFGNDSRNAGALVRHYDTVMTVTKMKKQESFDDSKFHQIDKLVSGQGSGNLLDAASLFLNYTSNLNNFHKRISKVDNAALTFRQLKDLFKSVILRMKAIVAARWSLVAQVKRLYERTGSPFCNPRARK